MHLHKPKQVCMILQKQLGVVRVQMFFTKQPTMWSSSARSCSQAARTEETSNWKDPPKLVEMRVCECHSGLQINVCFFYRTCSSVLIVKFTVELAEGGSKPNHVTWRLLCAVFVHETCSDGFPPWSKGDAVSVIFRSGDINIGGPNSEGSTVKFCAWLFGESALSKMFGNIPYRLVYKTHSCIRCTQSFEWPNCIFSTYLCIRRTPSSTFFHFPKPS